MPKAKVFYKPKKKRSTRKTRGKAFARKAKKKVKQIVFAVIAIFLSVLVLTGFSFYKFINAPFSGAANADFNDTESVWNDSQTNLMVLELDDLNSNSAQILKFYIVSFDGENYRYSIYILPVDEEIEYALNYGQGTLRDIYAVGNRDQNRGIYLTEKTILKQLAIGIDGYVLIDKEGSDSLLEKTNGLNPSDLSATLRIKNWPKIPSLIAEFREVSLTNLKIADIYKIISFIRQTSETSSYVIELSRFQLIDTNLWDQLWQENQSISPVARESVKVFVANASTNPRVAGLASWGARIAQNAGAGVLGADNSFIEFEENTIITDNPELATVQKLARTLGIQKVIHVNDLDRDLNYNPQIFRTPVTLILVTSL